jgi:hypothetical protein
MSSLNWTRITALYVVFPVSPTDGAGNTVSIAGVDCALLPYRAKGPDGTTTWQPTVYDDVAETATILVVGPDVDSPPSGSLQIADGSGGGDLWARVTDSPEDDVEFVCRIDLLG